MKFPSSSAIIRATYDSTKRALLIKFRNGLRYRYYGVPREVYAELILAQSAGSYLHHNVVCAGYDYEQVGSNDDDGMANLS